jgi:tetratricopeptide (TPR) repeat protein
MTTLVAASLWCVAVSTAAGQAPSLAELERRVRADSNDALLHYDVGVELARLQRSADARRAFQEAVRIDPKLVDGWVALVRQADLGAVPPVVIIRSRGGRFELVRLPPTDSLRRIVRRVFFLNPLLDLWERRYPVPNYWAGTAQRASLQRAQRAFDNRDWETAAAWLDTIIRRADRQRTPAKLEPYVLWYHGMAQIELRRYDAAVRDLSRLLDAAMRDTSEERRADAFGLQYSLGYVHHMAGNLAEAARVYRMLVEEHLGLDLVHMRLAQVLEALGHVDEAVAERRNAVNANPDDPSLVFDLGVSLHNAGYNAEAENVLRQALEANPRETRAHLVLGAVLEAQRKDDAARLAYQRFLELAPARYASLSDDARRRLAELTTGP